MDPIILKLFDLGIAGICLGGLWLLVRRFMDQQEKTNGETIANLRADLATNRAECRADTERLVSRVGQIEDRSHQTQTEVLRSCARSLETNADAFRRLTDTGHQPTQR
jgi:hypothetical protein